MYQDYDVKKIQAHLLDILSEVVRVCEELHIDYFIVGGTALGAVRHRGFIPWDDDLDIGMTRENYERFLVEAQGRLRKDLFLQTFETESDSPFYFAKVRKDHTKFVEKYCKNLNIHQGIFIDIFPYDFLPQDAKKREKHYQKVKRMLNLYIAKSVTGTSSVYHGIKKFVYLIIRWSLHLLVLPIPKQKLFQMTDKLMKKYNLENTNLLGYAGLPKIQVSYDSVVVPDTIIFENLMVKCPKHIEAYLKNNFGDYMTLPPENKRGGHVPDIIEY